MPRNVNPDACMDPVLGQGIAGRAPETIMEVFKKCRDHKLSNTKALISCNDKKWTWKEYYDDTIKAAKSFMHLGLGRFESVSILGFNSPEWHLSNMGAIAAGGFAAGIYTTNEPDACKYILKHSNARIVVVDGQKQLDKILKIRGDLPKLVAIVVWGEELPAGVNDGIGAGQAKAYGWDEFLGLGASVSDAEVEARIADQKPGHCSTLIYTSGTTGDPKAVMISHDNVTWVTRANIAHHPDFVNGPLRVVSYLPLSHIAAQIVDIHSPMAYLADHGLPSEVHFARPDALKGTIKDSLIKAKPTVFFAVPRVWEKFAEALQAVGKKTTGFKKTLSTWAKGQGRQIHAASQYKSKTSHPWMGFIAKKVLSKIKAAIGLDCARLCISGAAPISKVTLDYFGSLNIHIVEVYGMSENTGPQTCGMNKKFIAGTCGPVIPGAEIKIDLDKGDKPGNGEVCFRGRHVMMGYMHNQAKTNETIDEDGWLRSGDVGMIDPDNDMLSITGRIKELIITAGGENIAPVPVEDKLKELLPGISNAMMIGDKRKYNTVLITLRQVPDPNEDGAFTDALFGNSLEVSSVCKTVTQAKADPKWKEYIEAGIAGYNKTAVSNAQRIQKFLILDTDFSVPGGELTATQKLKRNVVVEKYSKEIESMY